MKISKIEKDAKVETFIETEQEKYEGQLKQGNELFDFGDIRIHI